jgi:hypothetical protein
MSTHRAKPYAEAQAHRPESSMTPTLFLFSSILLLSIISISLAVLVILPL